MAKEKITVETTLKSCNISSKGQTIGLPKVKLSQAKQDKVIKWVEEKRAIKITFELVQENLPGID